MLAFDIPLGKAFEALVMRLHVEPKLNRTICEAFCHLEDGPFRGDTNLVVQINFQVIGYALHVSDAGLSVEL